MAQAAKQQSQAAGEALARSQSAVSGSGCPFAGNGGTAAAAAVQESILNLFEGATGSNPLAQVKRHRTPQTDLFLSEWPLRSFSTAAILTRNGLRTVQLAKNYLA